MINPSNIPYLTHTWNPGGFGCSHGCPTCWARKIPARMGRSCPCPDCREFKVHLHRERLLPENMKPARLPRVIGVQFTGELFDPQRPYPDIFKVLDAAWRLTSPPGVCGDTFVFLTQRPDIAADAIKEWMDARSRPSLPDRWWFGATIKGGDADQAACDLVNLLGIPSDNLWLSVEPIQGELPMDRVDESLAQLDPGRIRLLVIGADNNPAQPFDLAWVRSTVQSYRRGPLAKAYLRAYLFVKQLWQWQCPNCERYFESRPADGERCTCGTSGLAFRKRLVKHACDFPPDLAVQNLPWPLPDKTGNSPRGPLRGDAEDAEVQ